MSSNSLLPVPRNFVLLPQLLRLMRESGTAWGLD